MKAVIIQIDIFQKMSCDHTFYIEKKKKGPWLLIFIMPCSLHPMAEETPKPPPCSLYAQQHYFPLYQGHLSSVLTCIHWKGRERVIVAILTFAQMPTVARGEPRKVRGQGLLAKVSVMEHTWPVAQTVFPLSCSEKSFLKSCKLKFVNYCSVRVKRIKIYCISVYKNKRSDRLYSLFSKRAYERFQVNQMNYQTNYNLKKLQHALF